MKRGFWSWLACGVIMGGLGVSTARAGEPVAGVDVGVAAPLSTFQKTAGLGGAIAPYVGYQIGDKYAVALIGQPQYAVFSGKTDMDSDKDASGLFSFGAGPRFSLNDEGKEVFFSAQGGVYKGVNGPLHKTAGGFSVAGGFNYDISPGTAIGLFIRRDEAQMHAAPGSAANLSFLTTGLSLRHHFAPAPAAPAPASAPVAAVVQAPPPAAPAAPVTKKIVLRGVNFDFDKAEIRAVDRPILDEAASTLKDSGTVTVAVEGHTDGVGTVAYNQQLSVRRAEAVRDYLEARGIAPTRLTVAGFGKSRPVASNDTTDGRAQNRRVELRITSQSE